MQLLIIILIGVATLSILAAAALNARCEVWKKCRACYWWFSDTGQISINPPANTIRDNPTSYGLCPDCFRKKVDLRIATEKKNKTP